MVCLNQLSYLTVAAKAGKALKQVEICGDAAFGRAAGTRPPLCAAWRNLICKQDPTPATAGEAEKARIKNGRGHDMYP